MSTNRTIGIKPLTALSPTQSWAYFPMNEGGGDGGNSANSIANDSRATSLVDVPAVAAGATEWSTRPGFYTPDGTSQYFVQARSADATAIDEVFNINEGAVLLACQLRIATNAARKALFHFGPSVTSSRYGVYVAKDTNNKMLYQIRDDAGVITTLRQSTSAVATDATLANNATFNFFLAIDNRSGVKTATVYLSDADAPETIENNGGHSISTIGSVTMNPGVGTPGIRIGVDGSSSPTYWNGNVRRMLFINYGTDGLPTDLASKVIPALSMSGCQPVWEIE